MSAYSFDEARDRLTVRLEERIAAVLPRDVSVSLVADAAIDALLGFDGLMALAEQWLDEHYPIDVPIVCDREAPDPGPRLAAALRDCLEAHR